MRSRSNGGLAASRYGLTVNFAAGKTEALVTMVGKKRQAARDDMAKLVEEREDGKCARIPLRDGSGEKVRVVQFYKHLGSKTAAQPIMGPEIAGRCSAGKVASAALGRFFGRNELPVKARTTIAESTVWSRVFHLAGTWTALTKKQA